MIVGDFNINLLSLENAQTASYQNMLSSNEFFFHCEQTHMSDT